jgi:hypothetical protein
VNSVVPASNGAAAAEDQAGAGHIRKADVQNNTPFPHVFCPEDGSCSGFRRLSGSK